MAYAPVTQPVVAVKTTTIRLLLGLFEPTAGRAAVLGFDTRTQADHVRERVGVLLERPGLWDRRNDRVGTFSKGMTQKLALARALLHRPPLVFLDEPTSGLDPVSAVSLREDLLTLARQEGVTVFLTTHNLAEAEKVCDRVGVIHRGRLLAEGTPAELGTQGRSRLEITGRGLTTETAAELAALPPVAHVTLEDNRATVELRDASAGASIVSLLAQRGVQIDEVRRPRAGLEEAFLALVNDRGHTAATEETRHA